MASDIVDLGYDGLALIGKRFLVWRFLLFLLEACPRESLGKV
jgi:hypothetical protein